MRLFAPLFCLLLLTLGLSAQPRFTDVAREAGIDHVFQVESATFGGGAAILDFDKDGWEDVYLTGGKASDALYRNNGDGTFTNVFAGAGFEATQDIYTQGVSAADINRDGYTDLLITTMNYNGDLQDLAPNLLYLNQGDGTFKNATKAYGLDNYRIFSTGATFADINLDGYPDLYVSNYFYLPKNSYITVLNEAIINSSFEPAPDYFFINAGGEYFVEASGMYGIKHDGYGFQGVFTDFDNDRDLDLLIANDFGTKATPNVMLRNNYPRKSFTDRSLNLAMNYGMNAMGIACGDYNFDGWMDYFVTNISASLFAENPGNGEPFLDKTLAVGLALPIIRDEIFIGAPVSWGANFFDYDHDQDVDLFVCNGSLNPTIRLNPNLMFENIDGYFIERAKSLELFDVGIGRGSVTFDYDKDGDLDLLVVNQQPRDPSYGMPPQFALLLRNDAAQGNWLQIELEGVRSEAAGIGSRVEVVAGGKRMIRDIQGGSSHLSLNSTITHFGMAELSAADSVIIKWAAGGTQVLTDVRANQRLTVREAVNMTPMGNTTTFTIFPSQFRDRIFFEYELAPDDTLLGLEVYDMQGRVIDQIKLSNGPTNNGFYFWPAPADLAAGTYIFRLMTKQSGVVIRKGVKM